MAIKRFIPVQDTFIVSGSSELNFGSDEILQAGFYSNDMISGSARILMKLSSGSTYFNPNSYTSSTHKAILHLTLSEASNLPATYSLVACTVPESWTEGFGRVGGITDSASGATWTYRNENLEPWENPGGDFNEVYDGRYSILESIGVDLDGSDSTRTVYSLAVDGGSAYGIYSSSSISFKKHWSWQRYTKPDVKNLDLDITNMVDYWLSGGLNEGLVLRFVDETLCRERKTSLSFYSTDTHTVYRPYVELSWDDAEYTGSLSTLSDSYNISVQNLQKTYRVTDLVKVNVSVNSIFPSRVYSTSSIYRNNYKLPETSYWGIKDEYTGEMIVDFNEIGSKISVNDSGSYFYVDMGMLEPEHYYRLLFQVHGETEKLVLDGRNIFRVIRNGFYE